MITGVILTHNEARNIVRCIRHLRPHVSEIILIDTSSTDETVDLAKPLVEMVLIHPHVANFDSVRNIAIPAATNEWLWFVDADEFIPAQTGDLVRDWIRENGDEFDAITIPFKTFFCGKWMQHSGWWPGYTCPRVLRRGHFEFSRQLHSGVELRGREVLVPADGQLAVEHQSYRDLSHWLEKSNRYTTTEATQLASKGVLYDWREAVRLMTKDLWMFYEQKQGVLDGEHGWILALCSAFYRWFAFAKLIDMGRSPEQLGQEQSIPTDIDQFLEVMTKSLAECRALTPHAPLGVTFRIGSTANVNGLNDCIQSLLALGRVVVLEGECNQLEPRNQQESHLFAALANGRSAPSDVCVTLASAQSIPPAANGHFINIVSLPECTNRDCAQLVQFDALAGYDEVWLGDDALHWSLVERGMDDEKIVSDWNKQFAALPELLREIDRAISQVPVEHANGLPLVIEGEFFTGHSFSNVNERLASGFRDAGMQVKLNSTNPIAGSVAKSKIGRELSGCFQKSSGDSQRHILIRHGYPPDWSPCGNSYWIHIQPWEYGYLPKSWLAPLEERVDEIWVMSKYVERVYRQSGIPVEKIKYMPWGFDERVFRPGPPARRLSTQKSFRFLFVGGTIPRKGFDRLLDAYLAEFSSQDDVCLVVKGMGTKTYYRIESIHEKIWEALANPRMARIEYMDGDWSWSQLAGLYRACNCIVAPYRGEGFCLPVLEAIACGVIPLVPKGGPTDDYICPGSAIFIPSSEVEIRDMEDLCHSGTEFYIDHADLRRSLRQAYDRRHEFEAMSSRGSSYVAENFSWKATMQSMVQRLLDIGVSQHLIDDHQAAASMSLYSAGATASEKSGIGSPKTKVLRKPIPEKNERTAIPRLGRLQKTVLIQMAAGAHLSLLDITRSHHRAYALRWGMDYWDIAGNPSQRKAGWGKISLLRRALEAGYERVIWLDADAAIVDTSVDLSQFACDGIGMARHPFPEHWNTGVMFVRASPETTRFLTRVDCSADNDTAWMEQIAVNDLAVLKCYRSLLRPIDLALNSVPGHASALKPVIVAGHGLPMSRRKQILVSALELAGTTSQRPPGLASRNEIAELLNRMGLVGDAVEVGVLQGEFSESFLSRWHGRALHLVDPWKQLTGYDDIANVTDVEHEQNLQITRERLRAFQERAIFHRGMSADTAGEFQDASLDFVYLDANHAFEHVWQDLNAWYPKLRMGGILAGHDYIDGQLPEGEFGVASAVNIFASVHGLEIELTLDRPWRSWFFVRTI